MSITIKPLNGEAITKENSEQSEFLLNNHNDIKKWNTEYTDLATGNELTTDKEKIVNKLNELKNFLSFSEEGKTRVEFLIDLAKKGITPNLAEVMFELKKRGINTDVQRTSSGKLQKSNIYHLEKEQKNIENVINKNPKIQELINEIATKKNLSTEKKSKLIRFLEKNLGISNKAVLHTTLAEGIEKIIETNMRGEINRKFNNGLDYNQVAKMFADMVTPNSNDFNSPTQSFGMNS